jgi:DNA-binding NarL/FixJ family response regulator
VTEARPVESVRVLIADDHPHYREGLARLLRKSGIDVVGEAPNAEAAIRAAEETAPDVVIMDLNMPGLSAVEATRRLIERAPGSRVLVLSVSARDEDVTEAMRGGAAGYLLKEAPVDEVVAGIRAAAADRAVVSPRVATVLLRRVGNAIFEGEFSPATRLSGRELEVLDLVAAGRSDDEIAEALAISPDTVGDHAANIVRKLQVEGYLEAEMPDEREPYP